jgi:glutathione peroxidase
MGVYEGEIDRIDGRRLDLSELRGRSTLVVNVASKCGLTPQYEALQRLQERFAGRGFTVLAVPCNQFGEQEPGSEEEIEDFCRSGYGVTFPITAKTDVNGRRRHPLYAELTRHADERGRAGEVVARYRPRTEPESDEIVSAIEATLPPA